MKNNNNYTKHHIGRLLLMLALSFCLVAGSGVVSKSFAAVKVTKVKIDGKKYQAIKATDTTLYSGTYALGDDIVLNNSLDISYIDDDNNPTPTTIILNGHSLTIKEGSEEPVIKVSNGATLILKDKAGAEGKVVAVYESISVDNGYLVLENADISSSDASSITAFNAGISVTGDSTISGNNSDDGAINCGESVTINIKDNSSITGNKVAVNLNADTTITIGGHSNITGNSVAGLLCNEGQKIYVEDAQEDMLCEISVKDADGIIHDAKLVLSESYKSYKKCFIGGDNRDISSIVSGHAENCAIVKALSCSGHKYTYSIDGYTIKAVCSECSEESRISISSKAYYDESTGIYYVSEAAEEISIDDSLWDGYKVSLYPTLLYRSSDSAEFGFDIPSNPGNYAVKLALLSEKNNANSILVESNEFAFQKTCSSHVWEYIVEGNSICAKCKNCGGTFATSTLSVNNFDLSKSSSEQVVLYECCGDEFEFDLSVSGMNLGLGNFKVLYGYVQDDGSVKYTLTAPTQVGDYLIRLAVLKVATRPSSAITSTSAISYSYRYHDWHYECDDECINAVCNECGNIASVSLDSSEILYASRQFANDGSGAFDGNIVCEHGWSNAKGILPYHIYCRNGNDESYTEDRTLLKNSPADFYASIVLLNDDEAKSTYMSTCEKRFYYATIDMQDVSSDIEYIEFSDSMMRKPSRSEDIDVRGYDESQETSITVKTKKYYIGSTEELYWVAKNADSYACIELTNDIVVNPIVISDDGKNIYSASKTIYKWHGFGETLQNEFNGSIIGNGYTIYGLYDCDGNNASGLVCYGQNCHIDGLSLNDSVFSGSNEGCFIGLATSKGSDQFIEITNCSTQHCHLKGDFRSGGIIGFADIKSELSGIHIYDCVANNYIKNARWSGGLIGEADVYLDYTYNYRGENGFETILNNCVNLGSVYATDSAGGMIGRISGTHSFTTDISNCRNLGRVEGDVAAGGMVGKSLNNESVSTAFPLILNNNINLGTIDCTANCSGGLVGICYAEPGGVWNLVSVKCIESSGNAYFGTTYSVGASYGTYGTFITDDNNSYISYHDLNNGVIKLTSALARTAYMCVGFSKDSSGNVILGKQDGTSYDHVLGEWEITESADCTNAGTKVIKCLVCGEILNSESCDAHGHYYLGSSCIYCDEAEPSQTGSVFGNVANIWFVLAGLVVISAVSLLLVRYKRRQ